MAAFRLREGCFPEIRYLVNPPSSRVVEPPVITLAPAGMSSLSFSRASPRLLTITTWNPRFCRASAVLLITSSEGIASQSIGLLSRLLLKAQALLPEAYEAGVGHDEVAQALDIQELSRLYYLLCHLHILGAGGGVAGGVVVDHHNGRAVLPHCIPQDLPHPHQGGVDAPPAAL